jgi:hypothetical protein
MLDFTVPFTKTFTVGKNTIRVWTCDSLTSSGTKRVLLTISNGDGDLMTSTILSMEDEKTVSQLADAINAALGVTWPKEF